MLPQPVNQPRPMPSRGGESSAASRMFYFSPHCTLTSALGRWSGCTSSLGRPTDYLQHPRTPEDYDLNLAMLATALIVCHALAIPLLVFVLLTPPSSHAIFWGPLIEHLGSATVKPIWPLPPTTYIWSARIMAISSFALPKPSFRQVVLPFFLSAPEDRGTALKSSEDGDDKLLECNAQDHYRSWLGLALTGRHCCGPSLLCQDLKVDIGWFG